MLGRHHPRWRLPKAEMGLPGPRQQLQAPTTRGRLHVVMLDNDLGTDAVYVKHVR